MAALYKEDLGRQIKQRREELGLSQRDLADLAHVKEAGTVSRWERGERAPTDLDSVAHALQTTAQDMLAALAPLHQKERRPLDRSGGTQLDRIEAMLGEVLSRLPDPAEEIERETAEAVEQDAERAADNAPTARTARRSDKAR